MNRDLRKHISNTNRPVCMSRAKIENILSVLGDRTAEERVLLLRVEDEEREMLGLHVLRCVSAGSE